MSSASIEAKSGWEGKHGKQESGITRRCSTPAVRRGRWPLVDGLGRQRYWENNGTMELHQRIPTRSRATNLVPKWIRIKLWYHCDSSWLFQTIGVTVAGRQRSDYMGGGKSHYINTQTKNMVCKRTLRKNKTAIFAPSNVSRRWVYKNTTQRCIIYYCPKQYCVILKHSFSGRRENQNNTPAFWCRMRRCSWGGRRWRFPEVKNIHAVIRDAFLPAKSFRIQKTIQS